MLLPSNLRLLKVKWLYSFKYHLIQLNILWSSLPDPVSTWTREHSLSSAYFSSLISSESLPPPPPTPHHQSATPDTEDFSAFPNPPGAFPPRTLHPTPHFCLSPVCFTVHFKLYLFTSPTWFLQITVFSSIGSNNKGEAKREAGSITHLKELRQQFCLELKPKLFAFLQ